MREVVSTKTERENRVLCVQREFDDGKAYWNEIEVLNAVAVNDVRHALTTFAEAHNMVAFLEKPMESEGFEQIVDFLNASCIHYALTVNPIVYVSSVTQFWMTAQVNSMMKYLSAKTTAWNEFSSIVALAIICLSTNQQFNFSKFILDGMIRNLDTKAVKFLMYPRFVQLFVNQLEGLPVHHRLYKVP
ncbi:hypothetical protein Tco_0904957 [Tanacetum coccineum]